MTEIGKIALAIRQGALAVLPTDTVYGLVCTAFRPEPIADLYRLKRREEKQPTALLASSVDVLLECIPEFRGSSEAVARALLPGPFTLVLLNPARRFRWLSEGRPGTIGVRVPALSGPTAAIVERLGAIVATSANLSGGPDPRRLDEVPAPIRAGVVAAVDGGELPGTPSTVIDLSGPEPVILRAGAGNPEEALVRAIAAHT